MNLYYEFYFMNNSILLRLRISDFVYMIAATAEHQDNMCQEIAAVDTSFFSLVSCVGERPW